jgi:hypothetical protein
LRDRAVTSTPLPAQLATRFTLMVVQLHAHSVRASPWIAMAFGRLSRARILLRKGLYLKGPKMTTGLYTNTNVRKDFLRPRLIDATPGVQDVFIASAFFTDADVIRSLVAADCNVRLVVRLGFPTNPYALERLMGHPQIQVRFFTNPAFHPKLYIFGDKEALVGSANLTNAALLSNQEVVVSIGAHDPRFADLATVFTEYWSSAAVLTSDALATYRAIYKRYQRIGADIDALTRDVKEQVGDYVCLNIGRDQVAPTAENIFLDSYRKTYQENVAAFRRIAEAYTEVGQRKISEDRIPLRLEIDSFLSFVRDTYTKGENWLDTPVGWNDSNRLRIQSYVRAWLETPWPHFEQKIVGERYPRLQATFGSEATLLASTDDELFDALLAIHSFHDRLRFFEGGLKGLRPAFLGSNDAVSLRASLAHLVFGKGDLVARMADLIYDPNYKINEFGQANVQELVGWINADNLPVINGRTTKVLRFFGLDVRQL